MSKTNIDFKKFPFMSNQSLDINFSALAVVRPTMAYLLDFFCSGIQFYLLLSPYLCCISLLYLDLYVLRDDALII